jgi:hypothetical protein
MKLEGWRKVIVAIVTLMIQVVMLWLGKEALIPEVTAGIIGIIDAIILLIGLFTPTAVGIAYMHYNVEAKKIAAKSR